MTTEVHNGRRRLWAGHVSALLYRFTYLRITQRVDTDLFGFLGDRVPAARVVDCGCGPGVLSAELLRRGAGDLLAVDANASMVRQTQARLAPLAPRHRAKIAVARAVVDDSFFARRPGGFDLILFKRSLYTPRDRAVATLRRATAALAPGGTLVVIHPERSVRRYAFGHPAKLRRHTAYHLLNRYVSLLANGLGVGDYAVYTRDELVTLLGEAAPDHRIVIVPTSQQAYNIAAIVAP